MTGSGFPPPYLFGSDAGGAAPAASSGMVAATSPQGDRHQLPLSHSTPDLGGGAVPDGHPGCLLHHPHVGAGRIPQVPAGQERNGLDLWAGQVPQPVVEPSEPG